MYGDGLKDFLRLLTYSFKNMHKYKTCEYILHIYYLYTSP